MKTDVSEYDFERAFVNMGRADQFTYKGKKALYEYLIELEESIGQEIELDVINICCEYTEYENLAELRAEHTLDNRKDEYLYEDMESVNDVTTVIVIDDDAFIIQQF